MNDAKFLDEIQAKILRVSLLAIHRFYFLKYPVKNTKCFDSDFDLYQVTI